MGSSANRSVIIASLSTLLALGLFRFAYSALLPLLIAAQWFSASTALYLSTANLCGYLMGALSANPLNQRFSHTQLIITAALLGSASLLACAIAHLPIAWYVVWRMVAGITGAWLMVLAPSWALRQVPVAAKNTASAWVFAGIGFGVLLSAFLLPYMPSLGLKLTWLILGCGSLLLSLLIILLLLKHPHTSTTLSSAVAIKPNHTKPPYASAVFIILAYGCFGMGYLPHALFWVDYLARDLAWDLHTVDTQWLLYGLGAAVGNGLGFVLVKHWGWMKANSICFILYAIAIALPLFSQQTSVLALSSFVTGALVPVMVAMSSGCLLLLLGSDLHQRFWGYATAFFSVCQFGGGLLMSHILTSSHHYPYVFSLGSALLLAGGLLSGRNWWQQKHG